MPALFRVCAEKTSAKTVKCPIGKSAQSCAALNHVATVFSSPFHACFLSHRLTHYVVSKDTAIALGYDVCPTTDTTPANRKGGGGQAQKTNAALAAAKNGTTAPPPPSSASKSAAVTKNDSAGPVSKSVSTNGVPTGVSSCHQPVSDNDMANPPTSLSASSSANCGPEMEKNPPPPHPHEHTKMNGSSAAEGNHVTRCAH